MFKRILICLLTVLLVACHNVDKKENIEIQELETIDPIRNVFLFEEISEEYQALIKKANADNEYHNYQFMMLGKDVYEKELIDIYGKQINLKQLGTFVLELASLDCKHCKEFISKYYEEVTNKDIAFIQYFHEGTYEDVLNYYEELGIELNDNLIIIVGDEDFFVYLKNTLEVSTYPTLISFYEGKLSFCGVGDYTPNSLDSFYNLSFVERLDLSLLVNEDNESIFNLLRTSDDVYNDLSADNRNLLKELDNDDYSLSATLKLIGLTCDFENISNEKSKIYLNEIEDFSYYQDKQLVLLYTSLRSKDDQKRIEEINELIEQNEGYEYILVLIEGINNASEIYNSLDIKAKCKVVSVLGYMPDDFFRIGIGSYPTAIFVEKGIFAGVYSNIEADKFAKALKLFLGDTSIVYLKNN